MSATVEVPVWGVVLFLALAFAVAWVNAWVMARFVRQGGALIAPAVVRLQERQAEREAKRMLAPSLADDLGLSEEDEGRVVP